MLAPESALPPCGYGIQEFERIAGLPRKVGYAKVKSGEVKAFRGMDGQLKVSPYEVYAYLKRKESDSKD
jgi:hypothetical protein